MIARLGVTFQPHRAHLVRALLETHGVTASVWHEEVCHLWAPGVFHKCFVVVDDDDWDNAREILVARLEVENENNTVVSESPRLIPGFFAMWIAGMSVSLMLGTFCGAFQVFVSIFKRHAKLDQSAMVDGVFNAPALILWSPVFGFGVAVFAFVFLLPLRLMYRKPFMGLVSYVLPRFIYPMVIVVVLLILDAVLKTRATSGAHTHSLFSP